MSREQSKRINYMDLRVPVRRMRACVRASKRASERANAWGVVYLAEREARLRTTVKEVPMSYGAEGERRRACVPHRESRIASLTSRRQVGRPPAHFCLRNPFSQPMRYPEHSSQSNTLPCLFLLSSLELAHRKTRKLLKPAVISLKVISFFIW